MQYASVKGQIITCTISDTTTTDVHCYNYITVYVNSKFYISDKCERLEAPENGNVKQTGVVLGSRALYSCDEGFVLSGDRKRICQRDGTFSGNAPTCESTLIINCNSLPFNFMLP